MIQHLYATHVCILTDGKVSTRQDSDDDSNQPELDDDWPRDARDDPQKDDNEPSIPQNDVHQRPWPRTGRQQAEVKTDVSDGVKKITAPTFPFATRSNWMLRVTLRSKLS